MFTMHLLLFNILVDKRQYTLTLQMITAHTLYVSYTYTAIS